MLWAHRARVRLLPGVGPLVRRNNGALVAEPDRAHRAGVRPLTRVGPCRVASLWCRNCGAEQAIKRWGVPGVDPLVPRQLAGTLEPLLAVPTDVIFCSGGNRRSVGSTAVHRARCSRRCHRSTVRPTAARSGSGLGWQWFRAGMAVVPGWDGSGGGSGLGWQWWRLAHRVGISGGPLSAAPVFHPSFHQSYLRRFLEEMFAI